MGLALRALTPKAVISRTERMEVIMKVSECMTREVEIVDPDTTLQNTARIMAEIDAGILPVSDGERLIGIITDRDIAVRGVALGRSPDRSEEHTSELQSLMRISDAVFCLKKKK